MIDGSGVFAEEYIPADAIVWKFDPSHDRQISAGAYSGLSDIEKTNIRKVGYVSPTSGDWIFPPENDPARYTNHSETKNNLSATFNPNISHEPFFVANRNIGKGEELTVNYSEFDASIKDGKPEWMQVTK